MDAILLAGGLPQPGEPLFAFTGGKVKAMLDICGKPMIQWVLNALDQAKMVERVTIVGIEPQAELHSSRLQGYLPDQGSILDNIRSGVAKNMEINPDCKHVAIVSSDIPAISAEQVDWVIRSALETDHDLYYNVVRREVMEKRFPGSNRSYVHMKGMDVCGGDLNVLRASIVTGNDELWKKIIASRKNALRQAALIGYGTLILLLFRQVTLEAAVSRVARRIHMAGRALVCPYAEVAMDVDKPHQLEIMRRDLCRNA